MHELERDLPTTREDVLALRRCRKLTKMTFNEYLKFLESFPARTQQLRLRKPFVGPPFELL